MFTKGATEEQVHYDIEVSQMRGYLFSGDAKLGFVENGATNIYEIKTYYVSNTTELILKVMPFT